MIELLIIKYVLYELPYEKNSIFRNSRESETLINLYIVYENEVFTRIDFLYFLKWHSRGFFSVNT